MQGLADDRIDFAILAADRIDLFERRHDETQRRTVFRCFASISGQDAQGAIVRHDAGAGRSDTDLRTLARRALENPALSQPFSLAAPDGWPRFADARDRMGLFVYLDFFRAWQVADQAAARMVESLAEAPQKFVAALDQIAGPLLPIHDMNLTHRAQALAPVLLPALQARLAQGASQPERDTCGYAMRMLGDVLMRASDPAMALQAFALGCSAEDNPFRRRRAIEAAHAANDREALALHAAAFQARWPLPADLLALQQGSTG